MVPVITLVFYYHPDAWDGSLDLHGILRWSDDEQRIRFCKNMYPTIGSIWLMREI